MVTGSDEEEKLTLGVALFTSPSILVRRVAAEWLGLIAAIAQVSRPHALHLFEKVSGPRQICPHPIMVLRVNRGSGRGRYFHGAAGSSGVTTATACIRHLARAVRGQPDSGKE